MTRWWLPLDDTGYSEQDVVLTQQVRQTPWARVHGWWTLPSLEEGVSLRLATTLDKQFDGLTTDARRSLTEKTLHIVRRGGPFH